MTPILVKLFAAALALSQVATRPAAISTHFDPVKDQSEVVQLLRAGCSHVRETLGVDAADLDDLVNTTMNDPRMKAGDTVLRGINFDDLLGAYREFCKDEPVDHSPIDVGAVIDYFNKATSSLPDYAKLESYHGPVRTEVLDANGGRLKELGDPSRPSIWVPLDQTPEQVRQAFVAAEDRRFYQHHGIDEEGMMRAFANDLTKAGPLQGGSTITQQVVKNLLTGDARTYGRKIREIILASRIEQALGKDRILEIYLNSIYLGRGAWGIELAARNYFGKHAKDLTLAEGALLAALTRGPNYFSPDRHLDRARTRYAYVLGRMRDDGFIEADREQQAVQQLPKLAATAPVQRAHGAPYATDDVAREAKAAGFDPSAASYTIHSSIRPDLQAATEAALQEGLAKYELESGRARFNGAEANLADAVARIEAEQASGNAPEPKQLAWQQALTQAQVPLYDVHWPTAIVVAGSGRGRSDLRVGLRDGRILPLQTEGTDARQQLKLYDLVFVNVTESRHGARAELRVRPSAQGAAMVLENKTGRILAVAGGFSYALSQLDRATQSRRQPGSALKPLTYLAALQAGLQPNTLVLDEPITLPPIEKDRHVRKQDYWSPHSYDHRDWGAITLRRALENSRNLASAHLLDGAIAPSPPASLDRVCDLAREARLYQDCDHHYPFILGAQSVRMIDLAAFYAAIANEGQRAAPHAIDSIETADGQTVYRADAKPSPIGTADPASFYQLKSMLQGVVQRGTARSLQDLGDAVAGKTGTTEDANDGWFVGFTNDVTVAVWVGYDNADGERRTLGPDETGAKVAIPIFEPIIRAVWADDAPRRPLSPPSPEARWDLVDVPIDYQSGKRLSKRNRHAFEEHFRLDQKGQPDDTQYRLVSRERAHPAREDEAANDNRPRGPYGSAYPNRLGPPPGWPFARPPQPLPPRSPSGFFFGQPF